MQRLHLLFGMNLVWSLVEYFGKTNSDIGYKLLHLKLSTKREFVDDQESLQTGSFNG